MNKLIKREFLQVKETDTRKRWFATLECEECKSTFTVLEKSNSKHIYTPCESCKRRITAYHRFIEACVLKHGNTFDYSNITKDNYVNLYTPVTIVCKIHGAFVQKPKDHTSKINGKLCCPECIKEFNKLHNKRTIDSWRQELADKHSHITMVHNGNADSNLERCTLDCAYHGSFNTALANIKSSKYICPLCAQEANSWGNRTKRTDASATVYHIFIPDINMYKIGVTSKSIKERFRCFPYTYVEMWKKEFSTIKEAYEYETAIFREYKNYRSKNPIKIKFGGYTELLTCEIPITAFRSSNTTSKES